MAIHLPPLPALSFLLKATELAITASDKSALTVDGTRVKISEECLTACIPHPRSYNQEDDHNGWEEEELGRYLVLDFGTRVSYDDLAAFAQHSDWEAAAELRYAIPVSALAISTAYLRPRRTTTTDPFED